VSTSTVDLSVAKPPKRWQADIALATVALIWGSTFVVVKGALDNISTFYFLATRFWMATIVMGALFLPAFRRAGRDAVLHGLRGGFITGVFLWTGYALQTFGLKYTSAGNSGFITGLYIVLVPVFSAAVYRKWPKSRELIGVFTATTGMAFITLPSSGAHVAINRGDLLTVGCAVAFAFHMIVLGHYAKRESYEAVALGQVLATAVLSTASLSLEPPRANWKPSVVLALLLTSIFATALAFWVQTWGQKYTTATRAALIFALEPVFALVAAVSIGGETVSVYAVLGGALILAAILLVELKPN